MQTITIKGQRGAKDMTKTLSVRKQGDGYMVVQLGNNIGRLEGSKLTTMRGTKLTTVMAGCYIDAEV